MDCQYSLCFLLIEALTTHLATFTDMPWAGSSKIHTLPHKPQSTLSTEIMTIYYEKHMKLKVMCGQNAESSNVTVTVLTVITRL
jgi:hypothetical protein